MATVLVIIAISALLIGLNALYVAAEFATVSARRTRVNQLAQAGNRFARLLEPIIVDTGRLDTYVAACQLGITASSLVLGFYGQSAIASAIVPLFSSLGRLQEAAAQSLAATVVLIGLTALQVLLGELVPKSVALRYPERLALLTVVPLRWSMVLFRPAIALFNGTGTLILRLLGLPLADHHAHVHSPEELELLVEESARGGLIDAEERELLDNALHFGDLKAADVMVPRTRLVAAPITTPLRKLLEIAVTTGYTRIPLYEGSIDTIRGIVHLRDLLRLEIEGRDDVAAILRPVPFVPESKPAVEVWNQLRQDKSYVAIVLDEFGGTAGMITMEDLIEEVFGELEDEFDQETALVATGPDGMVRLDGEVRIADINHRFGLELRNDDVHTIGGLVLHELGRVPQVGDTVQTAGVTLRVERVSGLAVREVSFTLPDDGERPEPYEPGEDT